MMQMGEIETDYEMEIQEAFKVFDKDNDGVVSHSQLAVSPLVFLRFYLRRCANSPLSPLLPLVERTRKDRVDIRKYPTRVQQ